MGVLNVTPDSFSDGNLHYSLDRAIDRGLQIQEEGADILDIGGESSRPSAVAVDENEEIRRVVPVIEHLAPRLKIPISIDTCKAEVARRALAAGAALVNDISALTASPDMVDVVREGSASVILMHMQNDPRGMQIAPHYDNVTDEVIGFLAERIQFAESGGICSDRIIIDPGIGFGKTLVHNLLLLKELDFFAKLRKPILIGVSRKSFIGAILSSPVHERLEGSIAAAIVAVIRGASMVRVHDVLATVRALRVADAIVRA
jgi:dihydropteroate synthase